MKYLKKIGFLVDFADVLPDGRFDLDTFKDLLREDTVLVSVMHVNNDTGVIQPVEELKKLMKSPAHYKHWKDNPQEDTQALLFGRAAHKYILETYDFYNEFAVAPNCDRRTKEGKETLNKFVAESEVTENFSSAYCFNL